MKQDLNAQTFASFSNGFASIPSFKFKLLIPLVDCCSKPGVNFSNIKRAKKIWPISKDQYKYDFKHLECVFSSKQPERVKFWHLRPQNRPLAVLNYLLF